MYEINSNTIAILPVDIYKTKIFELNEEFEENYCVKEIINNSCRYFGSSFDGRLSGTKKILGISYKAPIIIEESSDLIFFPTNSPRNNNCAWFSLKGIKNYVKNGKNTTIILLNNKKITINCSYLSIDNQILRSARLLMLLKSRKIN